MDLIGGMLVLFFLGVGITKTFEPAIAAIIKGERTMSEWSPLIGHYKLMVFVGFLFLFLQVFCDTIRSSFLVFDYKDTKK